ncbi:hypothetical protein FZC76_16075 [Sutcliffiella horikoshii]|uniref:Uncharacterized protein n=1 Tax=Sutcliffiella horikoshii TaxID=79883 RepID=A0A5D4SUK9_9BACI|nr:hypothetical protein [Sutcliffiella horikoshii]TYS67043.1 hypothetical protein FZC76_16075 [Sutcliffiella horikoshii]
MKRTISIAIIIGLFIEVIVLYFRLEITDIPLFKDLLSATISMGSIAVGFLAAAITLMPSLEGNKFLSKLKQLGGYKKILNALLLAIALLFILCLISLVGLFFDLETVSTITSLFLYLWIFFFIVAIYSVSVVIVTFLFYLRLSADDY